MSSLNPTPTIFATSMFEELGLNSLQTSAILLSYAHSLRALLPSFDRHFGLRKQ